MTIYTISATMMANHIANIACFGEFSFSPIEPQYFYRTLKHCPNHFHHDLKYKFQ